MTTSFQRSGPPRSWSILLTVVLSLLTLPGWCAEPLDPAAHVDPIWWEAEAATSTNMPVNGYFDHLTPAQSAVLSGSKMLNGTANDAAFAEYKLRLAVPGTYELFVRKWWEHGAFRWRFDDDEWVTVGDEQRTFNPVMLIGSEPINWQSLGYALLTAGPHVFRLEMLPHASYRFAKTYGFDCFVLASPGFLPEGLRHEGAVHQPALTAIPATDFGKYLPRTLAMLESASPTHHPRLKILAYGQSIVANSSAAAQLVEHLQKTYPEAVISFKNTAIGGYQAPQLRKTCWQDLYPEYPDLVIFHDYGGETTGEFEEMYRNLRSFTTAEVITWTHHVDNFGAGVDAEREVSTEFLKAMALKYEYEIADVRSLWKDQLKRTHESPKSYLLDQIHLNPRGSQLLLEALLPHFRHHQAASPRWQQQVFELPLDGRGVSYGAGEATVQAGRLITRQDSVVKISFIGNRLDLSVRAEGEPKAVLDFKLDGKKPSALASSYAATRSTLAPGAWWPAISRVGLGAQVIAQDYRLVFSHLSPDGKNYTFTATGSRSGHEGSGNEGSGTSQVDFTSRSGTIHIKAEDINLAGVKDVCGKDLPKEFTAAFTVYSMNRDQLTVDASGTDPEAAATTVIQCRDDQPHTLEIHTRTGRAGIDFIRVYSPSAGNTIDWSAK